MADTTGGDAFAAGFLLAVASDRAAVDATVAGHRVARAAIEAVSAG
ncbi:MAG: hypothetical protein R2713_01730 [Ilumatobacteraceae bacterium]